MELNKRGGCKHRPTGRMDRGVPKHGLSHCHHTDRDSPRLCEKVEAFETVSEPPIHRQTDLGPRAGLRKWNMDGKQFRRVNGMITDDFAAAMLPWRQKESWG